jgi:hypothetical protein
MKTHDRIYLLRLSSTQRDGLTHCRATLKDGRTHMQQHFADVECLIEFLRQEAARLAMGSDTDPTPSTRG